MTSADREYEDIISRALHAIVDPVEPAGDGLARIRDQISQPWLTRRLALLVADFLNFAWLAFTRCESGVLAVRERLADGRTLASRLRSPRSWPGLVFSRAAPANSRHGHHAARRGRMRAGGDWAGAALAWSRPALAVAAAVLVVAAGYYGLGQIRQTIAPSSSSLGGPPGGTTGGGAPLTSGQSATSPATSPGSSSKQRSHLSPTPGSGRGTTAPIPCSSGTPGSPTPAPSALPTATETPDPIPTTPTPTAIPTTPTPADSTPSSAPVTSDSPSDSSSQDGTAGDGAQQAGTELGVGVPLGSGAGQRHGASGLQPVVGTNVPAMVASCPPTSSASPSPGTSSPAPIPTSSIPVDSSPPAP